MGKPSFLHLHPRCTAPALKPKQLRALRSSTKAELHARAILTAEDAVAALDGVVQIRAVRDRIDRRQAVEDVQHVHIERELVVHPERRVRIRRDVALHAAAEIGRCLTAVLVRVALVHRRQVVTRRVVDGAGQREIAEVERVGPVALPLERARTGRQVEVAERVDIGLAHAVDGGAQLQDEAGVQRRGPLHVAEVDEAVGAEIDAFRLDRLRVDQLRADERDLGLGGRVVDVHRVGDDVEPGGDRRASIIGRDRRRQIRRGDRAGLADVVVIDRERQAADRLELDAGGEAARLFRLQVRRCQRGLTDRIGRDVRRAGGRCRSRARRGRTAIGVLRQERRRNARQLLRHVTRRRQGVRLAERGDAEAARIGAAHGDLTDRVEDRAELRRERALTGRIMVVATRCVQRQLVEDRRVDFAEGRGDGAVAAGAEGVQAEIALRRAVGVRVAAGGVDRFVEDRATERHAQVATRQRHQRLTQGELRLVQIRRAVVDELRRQIVAHRLAVLAGVEEVVAAVVDHIEQVLDVDVAVGATTQVRVHRGRVDAIVDVAEDGAVDAHRGAIDAAAGLVELTLIGQRADDARHLAQPCERVVRVERAVRRGAGRGRTARADVDRQRQDRRTRIDRRRRALRGRILREEDARRSVGADRRRNARVARRRLLEVDLEIGFRRITDLGGELGRTAEAFDVRGHVAVQVLGVDLADGARCGRVVGEVGRGQVVGRTDDAAQRRVQELIAAQRGRVGRIGRTDVEVAGADREAGQRAVWADAVGDVVRTAHRGPGAVAAQAALVARVIRRRQRRRLHAFAAIIEAADIGVIALLIEIAGAGGQRQALVGVIATLRNARFDAAGDALERTLGDDVDHARDRVRAIAGRGAVAQHVDALDDVVRDGVEVDEVARTVIRQRIVSGAQAVEQHQRRVGRQAAQRHRRRTRSECAIGGERVGQRRAVVRRQRLDARLHGVDAAHVEVLGRDRADRRRAGIGAADDRAGDDDVVAGRRFLRLGWGLRCGGCGLIRRIGGRLRSRGGLRRGNAGGQQHERRRGGEQGRLSRKAVHRGHRLPSLDPDGRPVVTVPVPGMAKPPQAAFGFQRTWDRNAFTYLGCKAVIHPRLIFARRCRRNDTMPALHGRPDREFCPIYVAGCGGTPTSSGLQSLSLLDGANWTYADLMTWFGPSQTVTRLYRLVEKDRTSTMPCLCGTRFRGRAPCERARLHSIVKKAGLLGRHRPRDEHRVEARIAPAQAPVEMGTGRAPGLADRADHLPLADVIAHGHVDARQG
ncbi:hypothetical protein WR25_23229 [Diploscapter pachys]|uniref:Uncharacterized protein n=1 Tax=Diploscapter pachys TaxID=2018661 RepID=A0A2A2K7X3_9BILA|nr:hypothetical protein WR25_23229 [Diploscapter pachys]